MAGGGRYARHPDGVPKLALDHFRKHAPGMGIMQWFHFNDPRLDDAVRWLKDLGVTRLRTGLSWWDSYQPGWEDWFDRQMEALEDFDVTLTFCFTPESEGIEPHHTSPPKYPESFASRSSAPAIARVRSFRASPITRTAAPTSRSG
jgi:beta-xylosidase